MHEQNCIGLSLNQLDQLELEIKSQLHTFVYVTPVVLNYIYFNVK